jgi:hypothetical protein
MTAQAVRGFGTWALVGAVCVLGLAALVDSVAGGGGDGEAKRASPTERTATGDEQSAPAKERTDLIEALRQAGVRGAITYQDTRCGIHILTLPELHTREAGVSAACEFTVSPRNAWSPEGASVDPGHRSRASCIRAGIVELQDADGRIHTGPGCFPAWTPSGRLTSVWKGGVYLLASRGAERIGLEPVPLLTRAQLTHELAGTSWGTHAPFVRQAAWLGEDVLAVIVGAKPAAGGDGLAVFRDGKLVSLPLGPYPLLGRLRPSPRGTYVSAVIEDQGLVVADASGELVSIPVRSGQAIAWSPDETFGVLASPGGTTIFETGPRANQFHPLPIIAGDLVWD